MMNSPVATDKDMAVSHVEANNGLQQCVTENEYPEKDGMHHLALDITIDPTLEKSIT